MKNYDITVLKFGGTSMGTAETMLKCAKVVKERLDENKRPFIVVSAISKMTDTLLKLLELSKNKKRREANKLFNVIKERHFEIINNLTNNPTLIEKYSKILENKFSSLFEILSGILLTLDYSEKMQANILSYGEDLSSELMELCLVENKIDAEKINSKNFVKTEGNYLSAKIDLTKTKKLFKRISPEVKNGKVFVMTGFFGGGKNGEIMLLGRGGSDFSGSIAGIALNASAVEIWTDANGIMTADPKLVGSAKSWEKMNKDVASEMARAGAKILHPKTIYALYYNINVIVKNLFDRNFKGTLINSESCGDGVKGIISDNGYSIIHMENQDIFGTSGFIAKLGIIGNDNDIVFDMLTTSETSITFTTKTTNLSAKVLKSFKDIANFSLTNNIIKISIVGENITTSNIMEKVFDSLKNVNIDPLMVTVGKSNNNIGIAVKENECNTAMKELHKAFIV